MPEENIEERANTCRLALRAALDAITDYCGLAPSEEMEKAFGEAFSRGRVVKVKGVEIEVPEELHTIAIQEERSLGERQSEIERSRWTRDKAAELCTDWWKLLTQKGYAEPMEADVSDECIMRVAAEIGAQILKER